MSAPGTVIFNAKDGFDEDIWDDSALIRQYDRALQSSRELIRRRQQGSEKKKRRDWKVGDQVRAVFSEDGQEYEGSVVFCNKANKSVTVRYFGYNNEEEVAERDLMDSLGQDAIKEQMEMAEGDLEEEEEEEGAGEDYRKGDWCRAAWSEDGLVYEAEIISVDTKASKAEVRFLGFGNKETKRLEELFMSKGEERRQQQEEEQEVEEEDIEGILVKNCPDLLRNFGNDNDLTLEDLSINDEGKKKKAKKEKKQKKEKEKDKSKSENTSVIKQEPGITQPPLFSLPPFPPSSQAFPSSPFSSLPSPLASLQPQFPLPGSLPPPPPPLPTDPSSPLPPELHSLLISWYMAGYHTGLYQGASQEKLRRKTKK